MSNKFWAGGSSSSESGSDSESDSDNDVGPQTVRQAGRFALSDSSSDDDDDRRVVRSQQDRVWANLREIVLRVRNALKNTDWPLVQDEFDAVNKKMEKSKTQIEKSGIPNFYIKMLVEVEDSILKIVHDKDTLKKLKPIVGRAVNRMKVTVKKHNKLYEKEILDFRQNPSKYDTEIEESDADSDDDNSDDDSGDEETDDDDNEDIIAEDSDNDDDDDKDKNLNNTSFDEERDEKRNKKTMDLNSDSEDSLFKDNLSDDSDSDSDDDLFGYSTTTNVGSGGSDGRPVLKGRAKWLKKADTGFKKKKKDKTERKDKESTRPDPKLQTITQKREDTIEVKITQDELISRVSEIMASRGRKGTDPKEILRKLEVLSKAARNFGPLYEIPVLMHLVSAMYDAHRVIDDFMILSQWRTCFRCLLRVVTLLKEHSHLTLGPIAGEDTAIAGSVGGLMKSHVDIEQETESIQISNPDMIQVVGSLESFLLRLEDEYTKSLQQINPHTQEYVNRLSDEALLLELAESVYKYYLRIDDKRAASVICLLRIEHMYYKHDSIAEAVNRAAAFNKKWGKFSDIHPACTSKMNALEESIRNETKTHPAVYSGYPSVMVAQEDSGKELKLLCQFIFKNGDERSKTRALLCSVFHHALHDRFYHARDLFLISHIQDVIDKADTKTQILYNRVLATLGLSAFREGLIQKAHDCLAGICSVKPLQVKELLAQGQARWSDKDIEQERQERRRQIPYHMHINPDLLDCCYLTCAMLLELPLMAKNNSSQILSKPFRRYFSVYNRQLFTGPPENTREHVLAATKALLLGDWKKGTSYILGMDVWNLIPNEGGGKVKEMLSKCIKEEAVRVYLLSNGVLAYSSLKISHLCESFDIEINPIRRIISKMIFNKELSAAWEGNENLVLHKSEQSSLQSLSVRVAEKLSGLVDSNERLLDPMNGSHMFGTRDDYQSRDARNKWSSMNREEERGNGIGPRRYTKSGASGRTEYQKYGQKSQNGRQRRVYQNRDGNNYQENERPSVWGR